MRVGLSILNLQQIDKNLFGNGLCQHILTLYHYLRSLSGVEVVLISNNLHTNFECVTCESLINEKEKVLDTIICIGLSFSKKNLQIFKGQGVHLIMWALGHQYYFHTQTMLEKEPNDQDPYCISATDLYDTVFISPHFEDTIDYYKYLYKTEQVFVAPFVWSPQYIQNIQPKRITENKELHVGVFENNVLVNKSCMYPLMILEQASAYIHRAYILCSKHLWDNSISFRAFGGKHTLFKQKKLSFETRHPFPEVVQNYVNVVVSYQEDWDLNYLPLETVYLGIPLIHNSKRLRDFGFYYEGRDIEAAAQHLYTIKNFFDRDHYIERHRRLLQRFDPSLSVPFRDFIQDRLLAVCQ